jgi:competence protein ComFC
MLKTLFFPQKCLSCGEYSKDYLCKSCLDSTHLMYTSICPVCQKESLEGQTHYHCKAKYAPDMCVIPFKYSGVVKSCIRSSKYGQKNFSLVNELVDYSFNFKEQFNYHLLKNFTVVPIPSDKDRLKQRGFNLPNVIAERICKNLKLKSSNVLVKQKHLEPFYGLNKKERKKAIKNAFSVKNKTPKNILLVDDILTTGATTAEATNILKRNGAISVVIFTLSYQPLNRVE